MPNAFNFLASPFDCLTQEQQRLVRDSVDIAYYPEGAVIFDLGSVPAHLCVMIKGYVTQMDGDEVLATYGPDDCFDGRGLVAGKISSKFIASEEVLTYQLARQTVNDLIADNATFGALLFSDLSHKLSTLSQRQSQHELHSLTMSRVDEAFLRPAHFVSAETDILSIVKIFNTQRTSNVLVRDDSVTPPALGIFTATALQRAILTGTPLDQLPVKELANFALVTISPDAQVGDALAQMLRYRVHRVVVADGTKVIGVLEALDLFSFLSNHSHLITLQIETAADLPALATAASKITRMISVLYRGGTRINLIAQLVQELNARLFERAWALIAPKDLVQNSCLFVMGSEGRGEQLLKTDQDNALILRDGYQAPDDLADICNRFSQALREFGYPECPGHIMLNNPEWRKPAQDFSIMVKDWLLFPTPDSLMNLAIFMDAHAVCGDGKLLRQVQKSIVKLATDNDAMLGRFAAAIDAFGNETGWWNKLLGLSDSDQAMNIKKEGIFPLVHGIRSLALASHVRETNTFARIEALQKLSVLSSDTAANLTQSLQFLMGVRLKTGLDELDKGRQVSGGINVSRLSSLERDLLKDSLSVVKKFKMQLRYRFKLDVL
jgi:CBS domain-containing protein